ncbi:patatin-like phospholipase family protein [Nocardia grenadensis]|uniref:patatin-like phospholipase family protein n=1 Tax=Nocardia grenadensis TaxID=931537 RepID=UPI001FDEFF7C|nr:patatin family protein [Nocardia grenadensis]
MSAVQPTVAEVIRDRFASASRTDGHRLVLVVEGGGSRGVYSSGMVHALEQLGMAGVFDAVYGTSAGAINAAWLLCGRAGRGMQAWTDAAIMRRAIAPARMLRGRPAFDLNYLVHKVYDGLHPMDFPAILANETTFHPIATDIHTGEPVDLHPFIVDKATLQTALRASSGLPLLAGPPVALGGRRYFDGGLSETVPVRSALQAGATHALILRTRRADERRPPPPWLHDVVGGTYMRFTAPGAYRAWKLRPGQQALEDGVIAGMGAAACQIHPPAGSPDISSVETDPGVLARGMEIGRRVAAEFFSEFRPLSAEPCRPTPPSVEADALGQG